MTQMRKVTGRSTNIQTVNGQTVIRYHFTDVVSFDAEKITLKSGGYQTFTTKARMNQASSQFDLGYSVFQKDFEWFVVFKGETIPFYSGMELPR